MDNPETTPAAPITPEATPETTPVVKSYFGADGTLNEGWQSTLQDGYREEKSLATVKDAKVLAKMFVDTKRMVGRETIVKPSDISTEADWEAYHKAGGRPETAEDYGLAAPEGFPEELVKQVFPDDRISKWQERFYKGGVSKKAAQQFIAEFANDMLADHQAHQQLQEQQMAELTSGLSQDWGAAYEQNKHLGNIAITEGVEGNLEFQERLSQKFGSDPDFVRFASNLGKKFAEGKPPSFSAIPTPSDLQDQIDTLMADPLYMKGTQPQRMKIANKVMALRAQMYPKPANT